LPRRPHNQFARKIRENKAKVFSGSNQAILHVMPNQLLPAMLWTKLHYFGDGISEAIFISSVVNQQGRYS
jgi:hypothetical protein